MDGAERRVRIAAAGTIGPGERRSVDIDGREVTLIRDGADLYALWNRCPHANGRLGDGDVRAGVITCPLHRWKFDLRTGATKNDRRMRATVYPVRVEGDDVWLVLPGDPPCQSDDPPA